MGNINLGLRDVLVEGRECVVNDIPVMLRWDAVCGQQMYVQVEF
jgi:hypothetical protein